MLSVTGCVTGVTGTELLYLPICLNYGSKYAMFCICHKMSVFKVTGM